MSAAASGVTVAFVTMGCAKNEVDSAHMRSRLERAGYRCGDDVERADAIIVNTCSFIQSATEESIEAILDVAGLESVSSGRAHLVVAGCMPSRYGTELETELTEASSFVPCADEASIVEIVDDLFGIERLPGVGPDVSFQAKGADAVSAYVKISDGCNRFCSYCTIPFIRGRYHSFSYEEIAGEVGERIEDGAREIVLIAQDTGRWGDDFEQPSSLAALLSSLAEEYPHTWFRVMYIQPEGVTDELIDSVAAHDNVCSYFDIPFQHCDADILRSMNRKGDGLSHLELLERILDRIPDATLRTTLIAGFPGETDEQFEALCDFIEEAPLDYIGVFAYSREEGTRAYDLAGQVEEDEKVYRAQRLRDLADDVCAPRISGRIGREYEILVCGAEEDGQLYGRAMCQAPDVDGVTYLDAGNPGDIVRVMIEDVLLYEMEGTCIT